MLVGARVPSNCLNCKYRQTSRKLIRFRGRGAKEAELDDTRSFVKGSVVIIKESSRSCSASKGIESAKVLIPFHPHNTNAISIAPQWESCFRTSGRVAEAEREMKLLFTSWKIESCSWISSNDGQMIPSRVLRHDRCYETRCLNLKS